MISDSQPSAPVAKVDLGNCDREPIHIPGSVQSFGCLLALSDDWLITHASENTRTFLNVEAEALIGTSLSPLFNADLIDDIRARLQFLSHCDTVERLFGRPVVPDRGPFDLAIHQSGRSILVELEPADAADRTDYGSYVRPMLDRVQKADSISDLCAIAARQVKALTGFDRVMVYRFAADDCGEVIAEVREPEMETFLGLRYPASDIPTQARALYRRNLLRIISDVDSPAAAIIPARNPADEPLDLSMSTLRAVSPIHLEYLRNMEVGASMSISILERGRLWGLFACHHRTPRVLSYKVRTATELFGQMFAYVLDQRQGDAERAAADQARQVHDRMMMQLADGSAIAEDFALIAAGIGEVIAADGIVGWIDGQFQATGRTPTREEFLGLVRFLNTTAASRIYATDCLTAVYPPAADFVDRAAGILALPVSRSPRDYILLCRHEVARSVRWAGNPEKPAAAGPNGDRLTPRKSFKAWQELLRGRSTPWSDGEIRAAEALRITLLEVVLRMTDFANRERAQAQNRQELLIAELNHRVRNILNLIRGLVSQSSADAERITDFTSVIGGRIDALARAHDQVTRENWNAASLHELIHTEAEAYFGNNADRVVIEGPDVLLEPQAFSNVALVMHELLTNSAKYGALSDRHGQILIRLTDLADGALRLDWREKGGPPVKPPKRRGFGTTIIERSIPYELKGEASVNFEVTGLEAHFILPAPTIAEFRAVSEASRQRPAETPGAAASVSGHVLVVEDNLIIAMDAQDIFTELGADQVSVASSVAQAERLIAAHAFALAVLDINLGDETSETIADALLAKQVPLMFATGYGERSGFATRFPGIPVIQKPYGIEEVRAALAGA